MSIYKKNGRGTWYVERMFGAGLGRFVRATGTKSKRTAQAIEGMLLTLFDRGRLDVIEQIQHHALHPLAAYERFRAGGFDAIPTVHHTFDVQEKMAAWRDGLTCSPGHSRDIKQTLRVLAEQAPGITVGRLPATLKRLQDQYGDRARTFNKIRAHVQAFLRDLVGPNSQLWRDVSDVGSLTEAKQALPGLEVPVFEANVLKLPPDFWEPLWTVVLTGMLPKEFYGPWEATDTAFHIHGTKRRHRERTVPRVGAAVPATMPQDRFCRIVSRNAGMQVKQCRNTFSHWLEAAGVVGSRCDAYMGHSPNKSMRDHYRQHDVFPHLVADAKLLREFVGDQLQAPQSHAYIAVRRAA